MDASTTKTEIKCGHCGNDGTESSLFLTIDAKWNGEVWELEEREDDGGMSLDCLACDERTDASSDEMPGIFPYGMTFKIGNMAAIIEHDPRKLAQLDAIRDILATANCNSEPDVMADALTRIGAVLGQGS